MPDKDDARAQVMSSMLMILQNSLSSLLASLVSLCKLRAALSLSSYEALLAAGFSFRRPLAFSLPTFAFFAGCLLSFFSVFFFSGFFFAFKLSPLHVVTMVLWATTRWQLRRVAGYIDSQTTLSIMEDQSISANPMANDIHERQAIKAIT